MTITNSTNGVNATSTTTSVPASNTTTTKKMLGLAGSITPTKTGTVLILIQGTVKNNTSGDGESFEVRYGTGAAPANGDVASGTLAGAVNQYNQGAAAKLNCFFPGALMGGVVTGLTIGTAYWVDGCIASLVGGASTYKDCSVIMVEL